MVVLMVNLSNMTIIIMQLIYIVIIDKISKIKVFKCPKNQIYQNQNHQKFIK